MGWSASQLCPHPPCPVLHEAPGGPAHGCGGGRGTLGPPPLKQVPVSLRPVQSQKPGGLEDVTGPGIFLGQGTSIHKTPPRQSSGRTSEKIVHYFYGKFPKIFTGGLGWVRGGPAGSVALWPVPQGQEAGCGHAGGDSAQPGAWARAHYPGDLSATRHHLCLSTVRVGAQSKEGGVKDGRDGRATVGLQVRPGWRRCSPVGDRSQVAPTSRSHTFGSVWLPSLTEPGGRGGVSWDGPGSRASDPQPHSTLKPAFHRNPQA